MQRFLFQAVAVALLCGRSADSCTSARAGEPAAERAAIAAALAGEKPERQVAEIGGRFGGDKFSESLGGGAVVVGCEATLQSFGSKRLTVKSIKPIFELADGTRKDGAIHGEASQWTVRIEAEKGYAVRGIRGRCEGRVDGMCLVFARLKNGKLDAGDQYYSRWLGTRDEDDPLLEVSNDKSRPAIGLSGRSDSDIVSIGLAY